MRMKFPRRSTIAMDSALRATALVSGALAGSLPSLTHCGVTYDVRQSSQRIDLLKERQGQAAPQRRRSLSPA